MFIIDVGEMRIDPDTADFVAEGARGLVEKIDDAANERDLNRIESDLSRLQVVVHQAIKRDGGRTTSSSDGGEPPQGGQKVG